MPVLPINHSTWQSLRALARSKKPLTGRALRIYPTRATKDGTFLAALVSDGLIRRVTGSDAAPFEATYALTELGRHAAEYGECERELGPRAVEPASAPAPTRPAGKRKPRPRAK